MVKYDPKILQTYAEMLYSRARSVVVVTALIGGFVGIGPGVAVGGLVASSFVAPADRSIGIALVAIMFVFVFGVIGYLIGQAIAFWYRLKAQLTLCQKQMEYNTRPMTGRHQPSQFDEIVP